MTREGGVGVVARQVTKGLALAVSVAHQSVIRVGFYTFAAIGGGCVFLSTGSSKFGTKFGAIGVHVFATPCIGLWPFLGTARCGFV